MNDATEVNQPEANQPAAPRRAKKQSKQKSPGIGEVESKTSGRMRVRVKKELRTPEGMAKVQEQLSQHPDVTDVQINQRTGSVVVTHKEHRDGHEVLKEALKEGELLGGLLLDIPVGEDEEEGGGGGGEYGKLDQTLADLLYKADRAVYKKTGLRFRGQVISGSIAALGIAQILIFGISLEMLPGPILLYIAYDVYHRESKEPPLDADDVAPLVDSPVPAETASPAMA